MKTKLPSPGWELSNAIILLLSGSLASWGNHTTLEIYKLLLCQTGLSNGNRKICLCKGTSFSWTHACHLSWCHDHCAHDANIGLPERETDAPQTDHLIYSLLYSQRFCTRKNELHTLYPFPEIPLPRPSCHQSCNSILVKPKTPKLSPTRRIYHHYSPQGPSLSRSMSSGQHFWLVPR